MKKEVVREIRRYSIIVLIGILQAFNYTLFIVNNKFAPAGINGIATMLQYKLNFSIGYFSLLINIPLCIIAFIFVDRGFAIKSFVYTAVYSIAFLLLSKLDMSRFAYDAQGVDVILPVLTASIISGFAYGTVFKQRASTGGTDIIAKLISKKKPEFNFVTVIFVINAIVAAASYFVYGELNESGKFVYDFKPVILCILYCFVSSRIGNAMLEGTKQAIKFEVITDQPEELAKEIMSELHHGVTEIKATGMYSHENKYLMTCIINKHQINEFETILSKYPNTFAYMSSITKTLGNFKQIKKQKDSK